MFFVPLGQKKDDTRLIITQIILMQCCHYLFLGVWLAVIGAIFRVPPTIELFFSYRAFNLFNRVGWVSFISWIANAFLGSILCLLVVQRAVKCLDHTVTVYIVHFVLCLLYKGFPLYWEWWVMMLMCVAITALLGEYVCYQVESRDIPLIGAPPVSSSSSSAHSEERSRGNSSALLSSHPSRSTSMFDDDDEDGHGSEETDVHSSNDHIIQVNDSQQQQQQQQQQQEQQQQQQR